MNFSIEPQLLRAHLVHTPCSDIREYLNAVCVDFSNPKGVYLISTDGHRLLITWTQFDYPIPSNWPKTLLIPQVLLKAALVAKKKKPMTVEFTETTLGVYQVAITTSRDVVLSISASTSKYADWRSVVRSAAEAPEVTAGIAFQARLVADATKTLQFINPGADFRISRQTERGTFLGIGPLALYLLMGLSGIDDSRFALPDWLDKHKTRFAERNSSAQAQNKNR